jgi:aspartyl-tRNA(Asn)/glutamyl-tRNA(Gln) amidotransferase subunit B
VSSANASVLIGDKALAEFFEAAVKDARADVVKLTENWIVTGTTGKLHEKGIDISRAPISAQQMRGLMERIADGTISGKIAKEVDDAIWAGEGSADEIIERRGLRQISDAGAIERIVDAVLAQNARQVEDYRAGKEKAFNALVGQVMKATQGKANPAQVNAVLKARLGKS